MSNGCGVTSAFLAKGICSLGCKPRRFGAARAETAAPAALCESACQRGLPGLRLQQCPELPVPPSRTSHWVQNSSTKGHGAHAACPLPARAPKEFGLLPGQTLTRASRGRLFLGVHVQLPSSPSRSSGKPSALILESLTVPNCSSGSQKFPTSPHAPEVVYYSTRPLRVTWIPCKSATTPANVPAIKVRLDIEIPFEFPKVQSFCLH